MKKKKCKILLLLWTKSIQVTIVMGERKNIFILNEILFNINGNYFFLEKTF